MKKRIEADNTFPVGIKNRHYILDMLRGFALFGICLANFPEFSLYTFLNREVTDGMPTAAIDQMIRFFQYAFVDGKFYTLFSLLFGVGFSIIIANAERKNSNGLCVFYRRMIILFIIGLLHLIFIWSGDILILYALLGLFLPLFRKVSNQKLLMFSIAFLLLPIGIDVVIAMSGIYPSAAVVQAQQQICERYGINDENFGFWLRDAHSYSDVFQFLIQGAFVRIQEFIDGNRAFKVMGLFLIGFYIGRNQLYANLFEKKLLLKRVLIYGATIGLPFSFLYAWSALNGHSWGLVTHSVLYAISVFPLGLAYTAVICLWYLRHKESYVVKILAAPGQMALSNYIGQSVWGILIFYGIGFGLGANTGLVYVLLIAVGVYIVELFFSLLWLHYFQYGPLEWIWRMMTYKKWLNLLKEKNEITNIKQTIK